MSKPNSCILNTCLSPVAHGVLAALAGREDPAHGAANVTLTRLLREELDRLCPGRWDHLAAHAAERIAAGDPKADISLDVQSLVKDALRSRST